MKKRYRFLSVLLVSVLLLSNALTGWSVKAASDELNYTMKEDFETGYKENNKIGGWEIAANTDNDHGSYSLKLEAQGEWLTYIPKTKIQLEEGKTYQISFWYKVTMKNPALKGEAAFYCQPCDDEDQNTWEWCRDTNGEWKQSTKVYKAKQDGSLAFKAYGKDKNGNYIKGDYTIHLDDIVVREQFTVKADSDENGTATVNDSVSNGVYEGDTVTYVAVPNGGYAFVAWKDEKGEIVNENPTYEHTVTSDYSLTACFQRVSLQRENFEKGYEEVKKIGDWDIEKDANTAHGGDYSLKLKAQGMWLTYIPKTKIQMEAGKTYQISFWYKVTMNNPNLKGEAAFYCQPCDDEDQKTWLWCRDTNGEWKQFTQVYNAEQEGSLAFKAYGKDEKTGKYIEGDYIIHLDDIEVMELETFPVTVNAKEHGTATVNGGESIRVALGQTVTFRAVPETGYIFHCWKDDADTIISYEAEYSPKLTKELHLTAYFKKAKVSNNIQDFEDGLMGDWAQKGFSVYNTQLPGTDKSNVHAGNASLQFVATGEWQSYRPEKSITLKTGRYYKVSFWYKAISDQLSDKAGLFFVQPVGKQYEGSRTFLRLTNGEWRYEESIIYISGEDTTLVFTGYNQKAGSFEAYFDDIKAIELTNKPVKISVKAEGEGTVAVNGVSSLYLSQGDTAKLVGTPKKGYYLTCWKDETGKIVSYDDETILKNLKEDATYTAYFEAVKEPTGKLDFESKPSDSMQRQFTWYNPISEGYSKTNVRNGNGSLKVVANGEWGNYHANTSIPLKANTSYDISFWYKAESTDTDTFLFFKTENEENEDSRIYLSTTKGAWVLKRATIKVGATDTWLHMILFNKKAGSCVMYIDDIVVEKTNLYKAIPSIQTESFDEQSVENNYGSWNSDKRYTRNNSNGSIKIDGSSVKEGHGTWFYNGFQVEPFTRYEVSIWIYCVGLDYCTGMAQLYTPFGNGYSTLKTHIGEWEKISFTFDTGDITTNVLTMGLIAYPGVLYYADDLTLTKLDYEGSYGEDMYNLYEEGSLEEFSDEVWSGLSSNFTRTEKAEHSSANSGNYYLLANGQGTYSRTIKLMKVGRYALAASFRNIDNGNVTIEVLKDGKSLSRIIQNEAGKLVSTNDNEWKRELLLFDNKEVGAEYEVRITSKGGSTAIDDISVFYAKYLRTENPNDYSVYKENIEVINYAVNTNKDVVNDDNNHGFPVIILAVVASVGLVGIITYLVAKKRRKNSEKTNS